MTGRRVLALVLTAAAPAAAQTGAGSFSVRVENPIGSVRADVTAASTDVAQPHGFLFVNCRPKKDNPAMAANSVTLGRPWHPFASTRAVAAVVYKRCWMDDHVAERGWDRMSTVDSTGTRIWYEASSARLFEYGSTGPGAVRSASRRVLTDAEADQYTPAAVLSGWVPPLPRPESR